MHAYIYTYIQTCIHPYIHAHMNTNIHRHITQLRTTDVQTLKHSNDQNSKRSTLKLSNAQSGLHDCKCSSFELQTDTCSNMWRSSVQTSFVQHVNGSHFKRSNGQTFKHKYLKCQTVRRSNLQTLKRQTANWQTFTLHTVNVQPPKLQTFKLRTFRISNVHAFTSASVPTANLHQFARSTFKLAHVQTPNYTV